MDSRERGGSVLRNDTSDFSSSSHPSANSYAFVKAKKKEGKGYKTVGFDSSDDDDNVAIIGGSGRHGSSSSGAPQQQHQQASSSYGTPLASAQHGDLGSSLHQGVLSSSKSSKSKPFRLKKKKSFKDKNLERTSHSGDPTASCSTVEIREKEKLKSTKSKQKTANTNPFDDRPFAVAPKKTLSGKDQQEEGDTQIFGLPLSKAVQIDRCADGVEIPAFFRVCINYIEDNGLESVGVYRTSGSQSRIHQLKGHFNRGDRVRLNDYDVATVADVMKLFIRELPHKLIPDELVLELEQVIDMSDFAKKIESAQKILSRVEPCRRTLLGWVFVHMSHIIDHQDVNKMSLKNVALVLEPTLKLQSNKMLNFFLHYPTEIFYDVKIGKLSTGTALAAATDANCKSRGPKKSDEALVELREELRKKEASLNQLHHEIKEGKASKRKEEQLWDIQRQVTQLKRKIRTFEKMTTVTLSSDVPRSSGSKTETPDKAVVPLSSSVSEQQLSQKTFISQIETRPMATLVPTPAPVKAPTATAENVEQLMPAAAGAGAGTILQPISCDEATPMPASKENIAHAIYLINLYEALIGHNGCLREKIKKESEILNGLYDEIAALQNNSAPQVDMEVAGENWADIETQRRELVDLIEKYQSCKQMTMELNDAICSETNEWLATLAQLNTLRMRHQ